MARADGRRAKETSEGGFHDEAIGLKVEGLVRKARAVNGSCGAILMKLLATRTCSQVQEILLFFSFLSW